MPPYVTSALLCFTPSAALFFSGCVQVVGVFSELEEHPRLFLSKHPAAAGGIAAGPPHRGEAAATGSKRWQQRRQSDKMAGMIHILMASSK